MKVGWFVVGDHQVHVAGGTLVSDIPSTGPVRRVALCAEQVAITALKDLTPSQIEADGAL